MTSTIVTDPVGEIHADNFRHKLEDIHRRIIDEEEKLELLKTREGI